MKKLLSFLISFGLFGGKLFAQCGAGETPVGLEITTDQWGYEAYWEIVPTGNACGVGTVASGGTVAVGCNGGGLQAQGPGTGSYGNSTTINEGPYCLTDGASYDLIEVDDWGDGGSVYVVQTAGTPSFTSSGSGGTHTFTVGALAPAEAELVSVDITEWILAGGNVNISGVIKNNGSAAITAIDVTWSDGTNNYTDNLTGLNIQPFTTYNFTHGTPFNVASATLYNLDVSISLVGDADPSNDDISVTTHGVLNPPTRYHVYEEATGTWCGWCPRGTAAMTTMEGYANAIGIAVHNGDPMVNSTYDSGLGNYISGYPSGLVNRTEVNGALDVDPGNFEAVHTGGFMNEITPFGVTPHVVNWNSSTRVATIDVIVTAHSDLSGDYRMNLIVTEDNVSGSSGYDQANYYSSSSNNISLPDPNGFNWQNQANPVPIATLNTLMGGYHHVARAIEGGWDGVSGSLPSTITQGSSHTYTFNVNVDAAWDENELHFIGWVSGMSSGEIYNAGSSMLSDSTAAAPITASASSTDEMCGNANGTATVSASGGSGSFTYTWSNGATGASISGLSAGVYSVTVDDGSSTAVQSVVITDTPSNLSSTGSSSDSDCGQANGSASVSVSGASGAITYAWSNGGTGSSISGVTSGSYTVTYTDAAGCSGTETVVVGSTGGFTTSATTTDVDCMGNATGSASITPSGATGSVTYIWNNGLTTSTAAGLAAGSYSVTATDGAGCVYTTSVVISEPASAISSSTSTVDASCNSANGEASVTGSGGTPPYSYMWDNGVNSATNSNVAPGTYSVTVSDDNGCETTNTATVVSSGTPIVVSSTSTNEDCGQNNGSATVSATGGSGSFTYLWSDGQTSATAVNLGSGSYSYTVTDGAGCTETGLATISNNSGFSTTSSIADVACMGDNSGTASLSPVGATGSVTYLWSNGSTGSSVTGLSAGTYTVTATDGAGCIYSSTVIVTEPSTAVALSTSTVDATCDNADGEAIASASGGTPPYSYLWDNGNNSANNSNVAPGTYSVTLTDANGCNQNQTATVVSNSVPIVLTSSSTNEDCGQNNGTATISASGGTGGFTYLWDNGQTASIAVNLGSGNYNYTVTDGAGCTEVGMATVNNNSGFSASVTSNDVTCFGDANGVAIASATGGTAPYEYAWATGDSTSALSSLSGGTYVATVTDASGCSFVVIAEVDEPNEVSISGSTTDVSNNGGSNGSILVVASGGAGSFTYAWSDGSTGNSANNLTAGTYTVTATDGSGCTGTETFTISEPLSINSIVVSNTVSVYPNPTNGLLNIVIDGTVNESLSVTILNGIGQVVAQDFVNVEGRTTGTFDLSNYDSGVYFVQVTGKNSSQSFKVIRK